VFKGLTAVEKALIHRR